MEASPSLGSEWEAQQEGEGMLYKFIHLGAEDGVII